MHLRRIGTVDDLHGYLHAALQLEHATIPPYLTALYSMHPMTNAGAARILRVVVVEEMLHLTLAANLLNATGGTPDLTGADFIPVYPAHLPDGETDFEVGLRPFGRDAIETFLKIERPAIGGDASFVARERSTRALLPVYRHDDDTDLHFYSIGEFYEEISRGLDRLHADDDGLFSGDPARQVMPDAYYSGGGEVIPVTDIESARAAIRMIGEQGEGHGGAIFDHEGELAHYYRFQQLLLGRYYQPGDDVGTPTGPPLDVDWDAVYPVKPDARLADFPEGSELREAALAFSTTYNAFLREVTQAFTGRPELLEDAIGVMFRVKELASQIIRNPIPGTDGVHGAPIFRRPSGGEA